jgi:hypothetical protein
MRRPIRKLMLTIAVVFLCPLAIHAAIYSATDRPGSYDRADWGSAGLLPPAAADPEARLLVFTGRTGRWRGIFAVHSWIVFKTANASAWTRHDVVGWGQPVRQNGWDPDGRWFGNTPRALVDVRGAQAEALIPKTLAAIASYDYRRAGDYRVWPGPNSNTFMAAVLRAVPELAVTLPPNAIGKDFRSGAYAGLTDTGTGLEASLLGVLGVKLGWVEGVEFNLLGLVAGLDLRHPGIKLPGFGRLGIDDGTALAAATH